MNQNNKNVKQKYLKNFTYDLNFNINIIFKKQTEVNNFVYNKFEEILAIKHFSR